MTHRTTNAPGPRLHRSCTLRPTGAIASVAFIQTVGQPLGVASTEGGTPPLVFLGTVDGRILIYDLGTHQLLLEGHIGRPLDVAGGAGDSVQHLSVSMLLPSNANTTRCIGFERSSTFDLTSARLIVVAQTKHRMLTLLDATSLLRWCNGTLRLKRAEDGVGSRVAVPQLPAMEGGAALTLIGRIPLFQFSFCAVACRWVHDAVTITSSSSSSAEVLGAPHDPYACGAVRLQVAMPLDRCSGSSTSSPDGQQRPSGGVRVRQWALISRLSCDAGGAKCVDLSPFEDMPTLSLRPVDASGAVDEGVGGSAGDGDIEDAAADDVSIPVALDRREEASSDFGSSAAAARPPLGQVMMMDAASGPSTLASWLAPDAPWFLCLGMEAATVVAFDAAAPFLRGTADGNDATLDSHSSGADPIDDRDLAAVGVADAMNVDDLPAEMRAFDGFVVPPKGARLLTYADDAASCGIVGPRRPSGLFRCRVARAQGAEDDPIVALACCAAAAAPSDSSPPRGEILQKWTIVTGTARGWVHVVAATTTCKFQAAAAADGIRGSTIHTAIGDATSRHWLAEDDDEAAEFSRELGIDDGDDRVSGFGEMVEATHTLHPANPDRPTTRRTTPLKIIDTAGSAVSWSNKYTPPPSIRLDLSTPYQLADGVGFLHFWPVSAAAVSPVGGAATKIHDLMILAGTWDGQLHGLRPAAAAADANQATWLGGFETIVRVQGHLAAASATAISTSLTVVEAVCGADTGAVGRIGRAARAARRLNSNAPAVSAEGASGVGRMPLPASAIFATTSADGTVVLWHAS